MDQVPNGLARMLAMTEDDRRAFLGKTAELASRFLATLSTRHVGARATVEEMREAFARPLPATGDAPLEVLESIASHADRGHIASAGPRFFGFVIGGTMPVAIGADWLTATWDQNAGLFVLSPIASVLEEVTATWVCDLLELPPESSVGFVTGAQMANFTALAAARHAVLRRVGWNVEAQGLQGAPPLRVVVGSEVHVTVRRALGMLGLGTATPIVAAADAQGRMQPEALGAILRRSEGPAIVCAQLGDVNTGACDPVPALVEVAREHGAWVHVDGAFGLWAAASPMYRQHVAGAGQADSWATDAHKWLNVPQDSGIVVVRDSAAHRAAMTSDAAYLQKSAGAERDAVDWVPEFSRRARGIAVYAALRTLGRAGVAQLVENCCGRTRQMAALLAAAPGVEVLNEIVLNQALLRFHARGLDSDALTRRVIARVQEDGTCWLGGTTWGGGAAMRLSFVNWSTTAADVERAADAILRCFHQETGGR